MTGTGGASARDCRRDDVRLCIERYPVDGGGFGEREVVGVQGGLAMNGSTNRTPEILERLPDLGGEDSADIDRSCIGSMALGFSTGG